MKILPAFFLFFAFFCFAENPLQEIRLDSGSVIMLKQYIETRPDAEPSFPVIINMSCTPKLKLGKVTDYKCQASSVKYATKPLIK